MAKPRGKTPFKVGPVKPANISPAFGVPVGDGDGDGVGEPDGVPVGDGDGDGVPVGVPVGDGDGVPVGVPVGVGVGFGPPPFRTPATRVVPPFLTDTGDPSVVIGTACPFSVLSLSLP